MVHMDRQLPGLLLEATVPMLPAAASVAISAGGVTLASRTRSPHAPTVQLITPRARSLVGHAARTQVRWITHDADGGALTSTVEYSADGGRSWKVVAGDVSGTSVRLPSRALSASDNARLRVRVSDGFNATIATSGPLHTTGAPPAVTILNAGHPGRVRSGATLLLRGSAFDDADRALSGRHLSWFAGRRRVGRGSVLSLHVLHPGPTTVRLIAIDARGRSSTAELRLRVLAPPPRFLVSRAPTQLGAHARHLRLVVATTVPSVLTIAGTRHTLGRTPRTITIAIRPGASILRIRYSLRSSGGTTHGIYLAAR